MEECRSRRLRWAIFSDKFGVWFPEACREYYDKSPDSVTSKEFSALLNDFDTKLANFGEICFYRGTGRVHSLYRRICEKTKLRDRLKFVEHWWDIV